MIAPWHDYPAGSPGAQIGRQQGRAHTVPMRRRVSLEVRTHRITAIAQASGAKNLYSATNDTLWRTAAHQHRPLTVAQAVSLEEGFDRLLVVEDGVCACPVGTP